MGKIDDFHVEFDQKWSVYRPGQRVVGRAVLKLNDNMTTCDKVLAYFYGSAKVLWIDLENMGKVAYSSESIFFNERFTLWPTYDNNCNYSFSPTYQNDQNNLKDNKNLNFLELQQSLVGHGLAAGEHVFSFEYRLPDNLPTSFQAQHSPGYVRYSVKICILDKQDTIKLSRKACFSVVQPVDLNLIPSLSKSVERTYQKSLAECRSAVASNLKLFSAKVNSHSLYVTVRMKKSGFIPGERIDADFTLKNDSPFVTIKLCRVQLTQLITLFAQTPDYKMNEISKDLSTCSDKTKVGAKVNKTEYRWTANNLYIPAVVPNFSLDNVLDVRYALRVEICARKGAVLFRTDVPLVIGTVPIAGKTNFFPYTEIRPVDDKLPAYDNIAMDIPPPTYEESLAGVCEIDYCDTSEYHSLLEK